MSYPKACFGAAVAALVAEGAVKQRLRSAFENHLAELEDTDLPTSVRASFGRLNEALHAVGPMGRQTCLHATVQKMSSAEASGYAELIVSIYTDLIAAGDRAEPLKVVETSSSQHLISAQS